ncbi:MAG TPA: PQQ-binding-like beta-propeller repeat protein [Thermoanaerobaculaceae bacterium]|nr:PQQ-binding-like beta-propeller repeat protein [Thermoanaerobaculaceae bacterium]
MDRRWIVAGAVVALSLAGEELRACNWPQFDCDSRHSGANPGEVFLSQANVARLARIFQVSLPAIADGAPAYLGRVPTASGVRDLLFVTTKAGHCIALDAHTGAQIWAKQAATGPNYTTSSPAVDPSGQYVYSYGLDGHVHKYAVGDGTEVTTGAWPELTTLKPAVEKGSSALTIATTGAGATYLYVTNGGYPGDQGDYQGHVTAILLSDGSQHVFNADCSDQAVHFVTGGTPDCADVQSAIWARQGVVFDSTTGKIFMATGNGVFDANTGGHNWGDSVFALNPDGTGSGGLPLDSYTPTIFAQLNNLDQDLGSAAPAIVPAAAFAGVLAVQGGKDATLRLLDLTNLSGMGGPGHVGGELSSMAVPQGGLVFTAPAVWVNPSDGTTWVFVATANGLSALKPVIAPPAAPILQTQWQNADAATSPVVANRVLYLERTGTIEALDPTTGTTLWSTSFAGVHWESPIVIEGVLYATDESAQLSAYTVSGGFSDVPASDSRHTWVDLVGRHGISAGCGGGDFCPDTPATRAQMAVQLLEAEHGGCFAPPPATGTLFTDVPADAFAAAWIEQLHREGITAGCGGSQFCPGSLTTRAQSAIFVLRAEHGSAYQPPPASGFFADVPVGAFAADWIEQLHAEGITSGCGTDGQGHPLFCPDDALPRWQAAVFLSHAFHLE